MNKPIRVLQVFNCMNCGGAENMIMNIYRSIDREKVQFDFLVQTDQKCFFDDEIIALGGRIFSVPRFNGMNYFKYKKALKIFFREHGNYDIVHGHVGSSACIYLNEAKKKGIFAIAHSHSERSDNLSLQNVAFNILSRRTAHIADALFACSEKAGERRYGRPLKARIKVLNNAIDCDKYTFDPSVREAVRRELGVVDNFVVGHVGRLEYVKNHSYLLDVFSEVTKINDNAVLLLAGDGTLRGELEEKIAALKLQEKVIITGLRKDINRVLQAMDCFAFPSYYEGVPLTVIEAQAAGLPCLISENITDDVCVSELVRKLPIDIPPREWAEKIIVISAVRKRQNTTDEIRKAGYDIGTTAAWLTEFYTDAAKR